MTAFPVHSVATAPKAAVPILEQASRKLGFVPNLFGVMSEAPPLLKAYLSLSDTFDQTSFTPTERQVVLLAISSENQCHYCVAAHSALAAIQGVPAAVVAAVRDGKTIDDPRLESLRRFATILVQNRGLASEMDVQSFRTAGFTTAQVLEVVLGVGMKTLSNYTNHLAATPIDAAFQVTVTVAP